MLYYNLNQCRHKIQRILTLWSDIFITRRLSRGWANYFDSIKKLLQVLNFRAPLNSNSMLLHCNNRFQWSGLKIYIKLDWNSSYSVDPLRTFKPLYIHNIGCSQSNNGNGLPRSSWSSWMAVLYLKLVVALPVVFTGHRYIIKQATHISIRKYRIIACFQVPALFRKRDHSPLIST